MYSQQFNSKTTYHNEIIKYLFKNKVKQQTKTYTHFKINFSAKPNLLSLIITDNCQIFLIQWLQF